MSETWSPNAERPLFAGTGDGSLTSDERNLVVLAHLGQLLIGFIAPLLVFLLKPDVPRVKEHATEALNFSITMLIAWTVVSTVLFGGVWIIFLNPLMVFLLAPFWLVLGVYTYVFPIVAAVKASKGELYRYPLTLRLVK